MGLKVLPQAPKTAQVLVSALLVFLARLPAE